MEQRELGYYFRLSTPLWRDTAKRGRKVNKELRMRHDSVDYDLALGPDMTTDCTPATIMAMLAQHLCLPSVDLSLMRSRGMSSMYSSWRATLSIFIRTPFFLSISISARPEIISSFAYQI